MLDGFSYTIFTSLNIYIFDIRNQMYIGSPMIYMGTL